MAWWRRWRLVLSYVILTVAVAAALFGVQHNNDQNRRLTHQVQANAVAAYYQACARGNQLRANLSQIQDARGDEISQLLDQLIANDQIILQHIRGNIASFITPGSPDNPDLLVRLAEVDRIIERTKAQGKVLAALVNDENATAQQLTRPVSCIYPRGDPP